MSTVKKRNTVRRKSITEIAQGVPTNLKFGLIVAVAMFWADLVRSLLNELFFLADINLPFVTDLLLAIVVTALAYLVMVTYSRIKSRLQKLKL